MTAELQLLSAADFTSYVNQEMLIHFTEHLQVPAQLMEVVEFKNYTTLERTPFSISFAVDKRCDFPQAIYSVAHPAKGRLDIFLVPLGIIKNMFKYEAIFS